MSNIFNLANNLSFIRILLALIATFFIMSNNLLLLMVAIILIAYSELTDMLDGYIARRDNIITDVGKLLDPLSDSVSRFLYFFAFGYVGLFPIWLVLALFLRDIIVAYIRTYVSFSGIAMGARYSGKLKAVVQFVGQYLLLFLLVFLLRQHGQSLDTSTLYILIAVGSISTVAILLFLKTEGSYLRFSILGYTAFLIPFYLVNVLPIPSIDLIKWSTIIMILVALFTLYSLYDYILGFIENFRSTNHD
jgi:CDP-diacylglycerol--glycerol-3-phosphate 3-phosphatidyltransferase